jgi:4-carboxymuconolactone decarboxylase
MPRRPDPPADAADTSLAPGAAPLDEVTSALIRLATAIAQGEEKQLRRVIAECREVEVPASWVDELLLQSVLMVGYPRALMAATAWRDGGPSAPKSDPDAAYRRADEWTRRGEETCRMVYGANYERLRENVRRLHPALDAWMLTEGYGRTLSRPGLDLRRRELCTVAQTAVLDTPHQLHSHLRGALHAGATPTEIEETLALATAGMPARRRGRIQSLWNGVRTRRDDRAATDGTSSGDADVR